jgi:hypothetical protein
MISTPSYSNLNNYYNQDAKDTRDDSMYDMCDYPIHPIDMNEYIHRYILDSPDDKDSISNISNKKVSLDEKYSFNDNNFSLKYYDLSNNYSLYNSGSNNFNKINMNLNFNDLFYTNNVKKNKVSSFKKLIESKVSKNSNLISSKCSRNTKNLNKFITMFSGPANKDVLNEIVSNNLHNKI